jgi:dTDP-4-amino-4,6-dideoxygalactose transaminase
LVSADTVCPAILAALAAGLPVRAVITVDLFGQPVDQTRLDDAVAEGGAVVISDGAQSFGATLGGMAVGSLMSVTTTSFFPSKPLGCDGDDGAVFVTDAELVPVLRSLRARSGRREAGVPTAVYYRTPLHLQPAYGGGPCGDDLSNSELLSSRVLGLPFHTYLTDDDFDTVVRVISESADTPR